MLKKLPEAFRIQKESFYFIGDPYTEGSSTTATVAVTTEDTQCSDSFLPEILFVVPSEESVSIKSASVIAVRARRAFEKMQPFIPLFLRIENPHRHNDCPHWFVD